jgi:hypothetical protein
MHGCAEHSNRQSSVEADSAFKRGLAREAGLAPRISGQLIRWLR